MYSDTPDIIPFTSPFKSELLTQSQLETLKEGTLRLLDEVGVHFPSRRGLEIFADHGARVDMEKEIVRIPPDLVAKAMSTAPRSFVLGGREERFDLLLDGSCSYLCTDGTGVHVIAPEGRFADLETREKRPSRKEDVARMARVCDALPLVSFFWPMVSAQDYGRTAPLHQCHAALTNTLKHVRGGMTVSPGLAPYIVEMATVVADLPSAPIFAPSPHWRRMALVSSRRWSMLRQGFPPALWPCRPWAPRRRPRPWGRWPWVMPR
jgi:trimethylamine--corrinoid protein Co-methyltransferase